MHFPDLEVFCDWSTFFPLKSADVSGAGTPEEPLKTSAREASALVTVWKLFLNPEGVGLR